MQYETIILELLSRVQKLEEEVASLKNSNISINEHSSRKNIKVTPEMTKLCYEKAKEIYYNDYLKSTDLAQEISDATGMNVNTANMNIISIVQMLKGEGYNRILSSDSLDICLELIYEEFGRGGLGKALYATKQHIIYLNSIGTPTGKLLAIYNKYENKLK